MLLTQARRDPGSHQPLGLADHGSHTLKCSGCGAALLGIVVVRVDDFPLKYKALCPCGDSSRPLEIRGDIYQGALAGYVIDSIDDPDEYGVILYRMLKEKG